MLFEMQLRATGVLLEDVGKYSLVDMVLTTYHSWVPAGVLFQCFSPHRLVVWYAPPAPPSLLRIFHLLVGVAQFTMTLRCIAFFVLFYISLILIVLLYSSICSGWRVRGCIHVHVHDIVGGVHICLGVYIHFVHICT